MMLCRDAQYIIPISNYHCSIINNYTFWIFNMMYIITIIFLVAIVITIIVYKKKTAVEERYTFSSLSTLLQTLFVFITLWITIYTILSSSHDTEKLFDNLKIFSSQFFKMDSSLSNVSEKLSKLPKQLDEFSESVKALNKLQTEQAEEFKKNTKLLNETIISLHNTVKDYESNIVNYSNQLNSIVKQTDQQLIIWKEQQRIMLDEMTRKPILRMTPKIFKVSNDTLVINDVLLINDGNIESFNRAIFLEFPKADIDSISSPSFKLYHTDKRNVTYRFSPYDTNLEIIAATSSIIIPIYIRLTNRQKTFINYRIDYYSKYDSGRIIDYMKLQ